MRNELMPYLGQRLFCRGQVQDRPGNGVCLAFVQVETEERNLYFGHVWLRRGVTQSLKERMAPGEWYSFTAVVWKYQRQENGIWTGAVDFGLAFPEDVHKSYS